MAAIFLCEQCELEPTHDVWLDSVDPYIQKLVRDGLKDPDAYDWLFVDSEVTNCCSVFRFLYDCIFLGRRSLQKHRNRGI